MKKTMYCLLAAAALAVAMPFANAYSPPDKKTTDIVTLLDGTKPDKSRIYVIADNTRAPNVTLMKAEIRNLEAGAYPPLIALLPQWPKDDAIAKAVDDQIGKVMLEKHGIDWGPPAKIGAGTQNRHAGVGDNFAKLNAPVTISLSKGHFMDVGAMHPYGPFSQEIVAYTAATVAASTRTT